MTHLLRVALIGGGQNCEHDVSLASAAGVAAALDPDEFDVVRLTITPAGGWLGPDGTGMGLAEAVGLIDRCDVVLPMIHGPGGEDGTLAALANLAGRPCVGSGLAAGAVAMDKWVTKLVANAVGISTAPGRLVTATTSDLTWQHPVVVKPVRAGSSHGVSLVTSPDRLLPAVTAALTLDDRALIEDVVIGREIDVAVLARPDGSRLIAPPLEIVTDGLFDLDAKYGGNADFRIPAALDEATRNQLEQSAVTMFDALGCGGVARVDFFLTPDGPVLNEVNTIPGMTPHSQVPKMFAAAGIDYPTLLGDLVRSAVP